ncbi:hypothetical protein QUF99_06970 [Bacillus sp. DX4.1]|uniref:hypothetical protein n=1 Tax=Bacillus sp. DX4.1 TaxID=3055867 RepID=UPI0025A0A9DA|nr:hypothetical protein [Bacillus sp. DX4.1]MDM5187095.1 hypothetical protein [Bacillus sp. DX4.1]
MSFYSGSFISNPMGEIICSLGEGEDMLIQKIDTNEIKNTRNLLQFLRDRRTDTYMPLLKKQIRRLKNVVVAPLDTQ